MATHPHDIAIKQALTNLARGWLRVETANRAAPKMISKWTACVLCPHDDVKLVNTPIAEPKLGQHAVYAKYFICQQCGCSIPLNQVPNIGAIK